MDTLIAEYLAHIRAGGYSKHTIEDRQELLARLDRQLPYGIASVATEDLERWLGALGVKPPSWTLCTYYTAIKAFYGWAARSRKLDFDPSAGLARPRQPEPDPHPATDDQLRLALTLPPPYGTAVLLAAYAGLRCAEVCGLDRGDVTAEWVRVLGKGGRVRRVGTHQLIWAAVAGLPPGRIVRHRHGEYNPRQFSQSVSKRLTGLGMPEVTLHWFRAWYATTQLRAGVNIRTVQENLGHKQVTTTQIYTATTDRERRDAITALPILSSPQQEAA